MAEPLGADPANGILWTREVVGRPLPGGARSRDSSRSIAWPAGLVGAWPRCTAPASCRAGSVLPADVLAEAAKKARKIAVAGPQHEPAVRRLAELTTALADAPPYETAAAARRLPRRPDVAHRTRTGAARPRRDGDGRPGARPRRARRRPRPAPSPAGDDASLPGHRGGELRARPRHVPASGGPARVRRGGAAEPVLPAPAPARPGLGGRARRRTSQWPARCCPGST